MDEDLSALEKVFSLCWTALKESLVYFSAFLITGFVFLCLGSFFILLDLFVARTSVLIIIGAIFAGIGGLGESILLVLVVIFWVSKIWRGMLNFARQARNKSRQEAMEKKEKKQEAEEAIAKEAQVQQEFTESARNVANKVLQELTSMDQPMQVQQHLFIIIQQQMMRAKIEHLLSDPLNSEHILNRRSLAGALTHEMRIYFSKTPWNPYSATDCIFEAVVIWKGAVEKGNRPTYENEQMPPPMNPMGIAPPPPMMAPPMNPMGIPPQSPMMAPPMNPMGFSSQPSMMMPPPPPQNPFLSSNPSMNNPMMGGPPQSSNPFIPPSPSMNSAMLSSSRPPMWNPDYQAPPPPPSQSYPQRPMYA